MVEITGDKDNLMFEGLSTDTKPTTNMGNINTFLEVDTGKIFIFSSKNINPVTSNGWWEI